MAAIFVSLASRHITISASTPYSRAASASACAWLPAEIAITPRRRSSSVSAATRLNAPRALNAPTRWNSSAFSQTGAPTISDSVLDDSTGVSWTSPRTVSRAALTSSSPGIVTVAIVRSYPAAR